MPTERVGQIHIPGARPQDVRFVSEDRPQITNDEVSGGIEWVNGEYDPGNVLRYGADPTNATASTEAFQRAVDGLSDTYGGIVTVPEGRYTISDILVDQATFVNGGVSFELHPRAVIDVTGTYGIKFQGTAAATPMSHCGVRGGRFVGTEDGASYGLWFQNCANIRIRDCSVVQFFSSPRGTRAGIYFEYSIYVSIFAPQIDNCDFGVNCENDSTNSFRETTVNIFGGSIKTCYRALRVDDCTKVLAVGTAFENSSTGVYYDFTRTTGINNFSCDLQNCYFEKNGRHVKITEHGTAISRGINIVGCFMENLDTHYIGGVKEFEDTGSMLVKIDIDGSKHNVAWNYFSSTPSNTGTHDGATSTTILSDSTATWEDDELIDFVVTNVTKGETATITDNDGTTATGLLSGSASWESTDAYSIAGKEIWVRSGATGNYIGPQAVPTANVALLDQGTSTIDDRNPVSSSGTTGGGATAGSGAEYVELTIDGTTYKVLTDGTV